MAAQRIGVEVLGQQGVDLVPQRLDDPIDLGADQGTSREVGDR
jgi:hypothetical protein